VTFVLNILQKSIWFELAGL